MSGLDITQRPDQERSLRAARAVNAVPKQCWWNARNVVRLSRSRKWLAGAHYIEGWVTDDSIPFFFQHAWVELDNQIIEPTLCVAFGWKNNGWQPDDYTYFPVLRVPVTDVPPYGHLPWHWHLLRNDPSFASTWGAAMNMALIAIGGQPMHSKENGHE